MLLWCDVNGFELSNCYIWYAILYEYDYDYNTTSKIQNKESKKHNILTEIFSLDSAKLNYLAKKSCRDIFETDLHLYYYQNKSRFCVYIVETSLFYIQVMLDGFILGCNIAALGRSSFVAKLVPRKSHVLLNFMLRLFYIVVALFPYRFLFI